MLEETLQICRQMWSDDDGPFEGDHYRLAETICEPRPIQPRPRIMIGGMGERKTLRLVAQYADACNLFATGTDVVAHKLEVLERHCQEVGRDPAEIDRTIIAGREDPLDDLEGFLARMGEYAQLGVQRVWLSAQGTDPEAWVTRFAEQAVPTLREL